ncbi:coiled-coil domain-containing protein 50-like [Rhineura floridana]|uniref:coiled-coil domain-containing protein 50-like n=1 Tax=Rhineura floridana TaxID=261503 RepID=UPI002AC84FDB|nr:coiled-coil domain-containing protein 50-like [Rhineura floridana]
MMEVQVDTSCLPPVQEVCREFPVLEDGALAYCLQELEIEQHYASNIQKNQLVQRDIQIAKKLQDREDEVSALRLSEKQKQIEDHDSEIARTIQEDIQRTAEHGCQRKKTGQERARQLGGGGRGGEESRQQEPQLGHWSGTGGGTFI